MRWAQAYRRGGTGVGGTWGGLVGGGGTLSCSISIRSGTGGLGSLGVSAYYDVWAYRPLITSLASLAYLILRFSSWFSSTRDAMVFILSSNSRCRLRASSSSTLSVSMSIQRDRHSRKRYQSVWIWLTRDVVRNRIVALTWYMESSGGEQSWQL